MIRLVYTSRAETAFDERELQSLLHLSQANNERRGLSGRLVHVYGDEVPDDAWFAQVLEGDPDTVDRAMQRIAADELHSDVVVLAREEIPARAFAEWTMRLDVLSRSRAESIMHLRDLATGMRSLAVVEVLLYDIDPSSTRS